MPITRSKKRIEQYTGYVMSLMDTTDSKETREALADLGRLMDDMSPYMDPDRKKRIERENLMGFYTKYVSIASRLANHAPEKDESFQKLKKIMGKDIKLINDALTKTDNKTFDLPGLFEQARAMHVTINDENLEKKGGITNTRIHIQTQNEGAKVDGYFTEHEVPFDFEKETSKLYKQLAGNDPDKIRYIKYLVNHDDTRSSFFKQYGTDKVKLQKADIQIYPDWQSISSLYRSDESFEWSYQSALMSDIDLYTGGLNMGRNSQKYAKLYSFNENLKTPENIKKLVEITRQVRLLKNKYSIQSRLKINKKARIDKRNSAVSTVADSIGLSTLIPKSENMRVRTGDKIHKGTFMKSATMDDPNIKSLENPLTNLTVAGVANSPKFIEDAANIQILDYICGNVDRHANNIFYKVEKRPDENGNMVDTLVAIEGIDNDTALGAVNLNYDKNVMSFVKLKSIRVIPRKTAEMVMALKPEYLKTILAGYDLNKEEIDRAIDILDEVKRAINYGKYQYKYHDKGTVLKNNSVNILKVVDEKDFDKIDIINDLYDRSSGEVVNTKKGKVLVPDNINLYTRVVDVAYAGMVYSNMREEVFDKMTKDLQKVRAMAKEAKPTTDATLDIKKVPRRKVEEYGEMIAANKALSDKISQLSTQVDVQSPEYMLENYQSLCMAAKQAVWTTTNYYIMRKEAVDKKQREGKKVKEAELKELETLQYALDNAEELYSEYSTLYHHSEKLGEINKKQTAHREKAKKEWDALKKVKKDELELPDSIEDAERVLESDKRMNRSAVEHYRQDENSTGTDAQLLLVEALEIENREDYIKLIKDSSAENKMSEEEKSKLFEDMVTRAAIMKIAAASKIAAIKIVTHPEGYEEIKKEMKTAVSASGFMKSAADELRKTFDKDMQSIQHMEEVYQAITEQGEEGLSEELKGHLTGINHYKLLLRNGTGSKEEFSKFVSKHIIFTQEAADKLDEKINNLGNKPAPKEDMKLEPKPAPVKGM